MTDLTNAERSRLGSMLALAEQAQNPSDGERLAALGAAEKLLAKRAMRLRDLAEPPAIERPTRRSDAEQPLWRRTARRCLDHRDLITDWEFDFLTSLARFDRLSQKQSAVLAKIADRLGVKGTQ